MGSIVQLSEHVANQIAAGEVVGRPASVVKEVIENCVDAGASEIAVVVVDAGRTLIQVVDNGKGMSKEDAKLCFKRHATSKISKAEDLLALVTKGFRGEALASISAVALGADVIEKHFTSDKTLIGPDHSASMSPEELKDFILSIRKTELVLGSWEKKPSISEIKNSSGIRRGINAATELSKGTIIKNEHLIFKRPFLGINPEDSKKIIGKKLLIDLKVDQPILWEYLE